MVKRGCKKGDCSQDCSCGWQLHSRLKTLRWFSGAFRHGPELWQSHGFINAIAEQSASIRQSSSLDLHSYDSSNVLQCCLSGERLRVVCLETA
eukprot:4888269-Amphidinium_carterae.3